VRALLEKEIQSKLQVGTGQLKWVLTLPRDVREEDGLEIH
jgi:hypothetical protein